MTYIIPIQEETLDLIAELNGGVRPQIENVPTFYSYAGPHKFNSIDFVDEIPAEHECTVIPLLFIQE